MIISDCFFRVKSFFGGVDTPCSLLDYNETKNRGGSIIPVVQVFASVARKMRYGSAMFHFPRAEGIVCLDECVHNSLKRFAFTKKASTSALKPRDITADIV